MIQKNTRILPVIQLLFLCLLAISILHAPADACSYSALALQLWFEKMIPSLFPFMVLSGLIVRLDLGKTIAFPVYPLIGRLYRISRTMCTTLLSGFLFGFPLGAKTIAEQYSLGQLSKSQAQYLLSFCNNIGPVYLLSFALPLLGLSDDPENHLLRSAVIVTYFGIPLLYGLILRYTACRNIDFSSEYVPASFTKSRSHAKTASKTRSGHAPLSAASFRTGTNAPLSAASFRAGTITPSPAASFHAGAASSLSGVSSYTASAPKQQIIPASENQSFVSALDASVTSACAAITRLGGYMIFFMVCNLLFEKTPFAAPLAAVLEITSGLTLAKDIISPALSMTLLTFGGLSCFAQTYTCIRDTDLSFGSYCFHKILQSFIAFFAYILLFSAFS